MNINIHIERLILDGVSITSSQQPLLQAAVEIELAHLLATQGLAPHLQAGGAVSYVPSGTIQLTNHSNPTQMGQQIAQAVYRGIGQ